MIVSLVATALAAASSMGLIAILALMAFERWTYHRFDGTKWPADLFRETQRNVKHSKPLRSARAKWGKLKHRSADWTPFPGRLWAAIRRVGGRLASSRHVGASRSLSRPALPTVSLEADIQLPVTVPKSQEDISPINIPTNSSTDLQAVRFLPASPSHSRFANIVRAAASLSRPLDPSVSQGTPIALNRPPGLGLHAFGGPGFARRIRIAALMGQLKSWIVKEDIPAHLSLVRYMQFSPDGSALATARLVIAFICLFIPWFSNMFFV
jgi:hypothetical protein